MESTNSINDTVIIISVSLTVPFLFFCAEICYYWWGSYKKSFKENPVGASGRLARGIVTGFTANLLDNLYWGVTWILVLIHHPLGLAMMLSGSLANILFRQFGGIVAAREHLFAASIMHGNGMLRYHRYYWLAGALTFAGLMYWRFFLSQQI